MPRTKQETPKKKATPKRQPRKSTYSVGVDPDFLESDKSNQAGSKVRLTAQPVRTEASVWPVVAAAVIILVIGIIIGAWAS